MSEALKKKVLNVRLTPELFRMLEDLRLALYVPTGSDVIRHLIIEGYASEYQAIERTKTEKAARDAARDARQLKLPSVELDPYADPPCRTGRAGPCHESIENPGRCVWCRKPMGPTDVACLAREYREVDAKERGAHEVADAIRELQPKARKPKKAKK